MSEHSERRTTRSSGPTVPPRQDENPRRPQREITPLERIAKLRAIWGED